MPTGAEGSDRQVAGRVPGSITNFAKIGFAAVKADVPDGMNARQYLDWIDGYGLAPALSLFNSPFDETIDIAEEIERAKRFAAIQVELGLDRYHVLLDGHPRPDGPTSRGCGPRSGSAAPSHRELRHHLPGAAVGGPSPLTPLPCGGMFETEEEIVAQLDQLGPDVIDLGPTPATSGGPASSPRRSSSATPTGSAAFTSGVFPDYLEAEHHRWSGPTGVDGVQAALVRAGLGVVDFDAVLAALPDDYDGDFMTESTNRASTLDSSRT